MTYLPGTAVPASDLRALGFEPYTLSFRTPVDTEPFSRWDTVGTVPDSPGLYAFVLTHPEWPEQRVAYVGMTEHLWMVTKGRKPGPGAARGPQHYGNPRTAAPQRAQKNRLVTEARRHGCTVTHWLSPRPGVDRSALLVAESELIARWNLLLTGWNKRA